MTAGTLLVVAGENGRLPRDKETGADMHTLFNVYREMIWQICRDYPGIPDPRTLTMAEIRFFFHGLRPELQRHTKPSG